MKKAGTGTIVLLIVIFACSFSRAQAMRLPPAYTLEELEKVKIRDTSLFAISSP